MKNKKLFITLIFIAFSIKAQDVNQLTKDCNKGNGEACFKVGESYYFGKNNAERNYKKAAEFYEKACNSGQAEGCFRAGKMYNDSKGVDKNYNKASELFAKACDGGHVRGCNLTGMLFFNGFVGKKDGKNDYQTAKKYYQKGCDGGDKYSCEMIKQIDAILQ